MSIQVLQSSRRGRESWLLYLVFMVSQNCCVSLPNDAIGWSKVVIVVFPDHTHLLFLMIVSPDLEYTVRSIFHC